MKKAMKTSIILTLALIMIVLYIIGYFLTSNIFNTASDSFNYLMVVNTRSPCLGDSFSFLFETYSFNKTWTINRGTELAFDNV
jgi:hypothetical protein